MKTIKIGLCLFLLSCLVGYGQFNTNNFLIGDRLTNPIALAGTNSNLAEVAPPKIIKELGRELEQYVPQVKIVAPKAEQIFEQTDISIELEVEDLPIFRDDKLQLGNHLNLIIDNEPFRAIYNLDEPIIIPDLTPGTHTIRVFAVRPWGESFKTEGAYAQTTFNVLAETNDNRPQPSVPLLTYNSPTGTIGAEPLLLDFYLTNAPLHAIAQNDPDLLDWRIRATVNGTSFILEDWQPVYLTGLNKGTNWIQLELIDQAGNDIENAFNNTVRVINYDPQRNDTLAKLVTDQISLAEARPIVEQNYYIQPVGTPEIIEPRVKLEPEPTINPEESINNIEPAVEDQTETKESEEDTVSENSIPQEKSNLSSTSNSDTEQVQTKQSEQPVIIPAPETNTIEDSSVTEINSVDLQDTDEKTKAVESTESKKINTITQDNLDSPKPIAANEIPQSESAAISENETPIAFPEAEPIKTPEQKTATPVWWKKILLSLRQKLEELINLLPKEV